MALLFTGQPIHPKIGENCFFSTKRNHFRWCDYRRRMQCLVNAVVRGDVHSIRIGNKGWIFRDGAVVHCTYVKAGTVIGNRYNIGHRPLCMGCTLEDKCIESEWAPLWWIMLLFRSSIVAAGQSSLKTRVESGFIYAGSPAKNQKPFPQSKASNRSKSLQENMRCMREWLM